jgi:peptide/nickel transport system substrate-binding protein
MKSVNKKFLVSLIFLFAAGCSSPKSDPNALIVGLGSMPTTFDPRLATDANSQRLSDLVYAALVRVGPDLKPMPEAASSWKIENKKITFKIRQDLHFHDGSPVTMNDVLATFREYKKPGGPMGNFLSSVKTFSSLDKETLVLNLSRNDVPLMTYLVQMKILPEKIIQKDPQSLAQKPIGSGPYMFVKADSNHIELKKAPQQSYDHPKMEKIILQIIRDDQTRFLKMLKGELDVLANELPEDKVMELKKSGHVEVSVSPGLNMNYVLLNLRDENLKNKSLRHALFSALNREEIIKFKLDDFAQPALSLLATVNPFSSPTLKAPKLSLASARAVIKELKLEGKKFTLKTSDQAVSNGKLIAKQMESLGIKVEVQSYEWGTYYSDIKQGHYQMALMRWVGSVDPDLYRDTLATSEFVPGRNRGYYSNKMVDTLVEEGRQAIDFKKRQTLYAKAQQIVLDDMPILPLWYNSNISLLNPKVRNFHPNVTGSFHPYLAVTKVQ